MKCIYCHNDAKYSERPNGQCPTCQRRFALEPKTGDKLSDAAFQAAIERVSSGGSVRFTPQNLYYEVARRTQRVSKVTVWLLGSLALAGLLLGVLGVWPLLLPTALLTYLAVAALPSKLLKLEAGEFERMWSRWLSVHGSPRGLIVRRSSPAEAAAAPALPSDIQHYSFDRAVVTDREETVDLLLANNFHFENNCAILSAGGYPAPAFATVRAMLRQNPKLTVYVLHDASVQGCGLAQWLRAEGWFLESARIVDVGLSPHHAGPFKGCWRASAPAAATALGHSAEDSQWLARYSLELAVIRPEQIIKRLFRAMSSDAEGPGADGDGGDGGVVFIDSTSFGSDSGASDGGGDSFG